MKRVVVTGLGCVSPVGNDVPTFWDSLVAGRHGFAPITRFDTTGMKVTIAAEVKGFEPERYLERSEVRRTDLFAQYGIAAAAQAVAEAGVDQAGAVDPERFGVYIGSGTGGIGTSVAETTVMLQRGPGRISPFFVPMMIANMASALVAIRYGARGPNLPVVTACSSGTNAIGEAYRAIRGGYADVIAAGGAEASLNPLAVGGFTNCMALSTRNDVDAASIPFDARRDGFVMGEGAGVVVLEEFTHALTRGARIYGEVVGYANTCDAFHITAPHPEAVGSTAMIRQALAEADLAGGPGLYINAHGTSTPMNDRLETLAIKQALGEAAYATPISSTKSMTGHMLGAAGGVEAIAALKTLETGLIPPTIGLEQPDPDCYLDYVPGTARPAEVDAALSVSLGFGGHNAGVVFRRYAG
ncbi:MAG: beta-ketoacyl-ACP synthase II [Propionibacteriaceae bacterium]|jgi:3-oxoacyl-[acyl-carrier-protein] synthase II|nr:beta-ketoacyl-ACP synthase II [Propionibacteriaceae bacterium]